MYHVHKLPYFIKTKTIGLLVYFFKETDVYFCQFYFVLVAIDF